MACPKSHSLWLEKKLSPRQSRSEHSTAFAWLPCLCSRSFFFPVSYPPHPALQPHKLLSLLPRAGFLPTLVHSICSDLPPSRFCEYQLNCYSSGHLSLTTQTLYSVCYHHWTSYKYQGFMWIIIILCHHFINDYHAHCTKFHIKWFINRYSHSALCLACGETSKAICCTSNISWFQSLGPNRRGLPKTPQPAEKKSIKIISCLRNNKASRAPLAHSETKPKESCDTWC